MPSEHAVTADGAQPPVAYYARSVSSATERAPRADKEPTVIWAGVVPVPPYSSLAWFLLAFSGPSRETRNEVRTVGCCLHGVLGHCSHPGSLPT